MFFAATALNSTKLNVKMMIGYLRILSPVSSQTGLIVQIKIEPASELLKVRVFLNHMLILFS
jgi:hypothetical protein